MSPRPRAPTSPNANSLLAGLPPAECARLGLQAALVPLRLGEVLHESGSRLRRALFPVTALVSLLSVLEDGAAAGLALVGKDGCVGIPILLSGGVAHDRAVVQVAGDAYEIPASAMLGEFNRAGALQAVLLRYIQARITEVGQTAVCNRHHSTEQKLCRWILLSLDRLAGDELPLTQKLIGSMLGVQRSGITQAAGHLKAAGLIEYRHGHIRVPDRAKLLARTCECYSVITRESQRVFSSGPRPATRAVPQSRAVLLQP